MPNEEDIIESVEDDDEGEGENEDEDQSWVLDSLVGFLKSPLWSSSLNNFVDQMSVVFEPDDIEDNEGNVEHRPEYESVFKQYRALVDQLITSHMTELGISEAQFASACEMAEGVLASKLKSVLFEELWAAENFEVFVRLMSRRNVELQLEALDTLAQQYGLVYDVFVPIGTSAKHFLSEEHVMREAILRSLDDMEQGNEQGEGEEDARRTESLLSRRFSKLKSNDKSNAAAAADKQAPSSEAAAEKSGETSGETAEYKRDKARLEEVRQRVDQKMYQALQLALADELVDAGETEGEGTSEKTSSITAESSEKESAKFTAVAEPSPDDEENEKTAEEEKELVAGNAKREEEIKQRAAHLRSQRDKIIQLKQKERTEKISKYLIKEREKLKSQPRPKTARRPESAAKATSGQAEAEQSKEHAYRKTLAARLKAEVVLNDK